MTTDCCSSGVEQLLPHNPDQRDLPVPLPNNKLPTQHRLPSNKLTDNKLPAQHRLPVLQLVLPAALSPIAISSKTAVVTGGTALTSWCCECKVK